jgi:hypothetical protein
MINNIQRQQMLAALNDTFRRAVMGGGTVIYTAAVNALPPAEQHRVREAVQYFDAFTANSDPHGEHDFGEFEIEGKRFFWKIDYYDPEMNFGSQDPTDPARTKRVLTVMLADET